jgi:hypothetical protein
VGRRKGTFGAPSRRSGKRARRLPQDRELAGSRRLSGSLGRSLPCRCPLAANLAGQDVRSYGTHFSAGISRLVSAFQAANIPASSTLATRHGSAHVDNRS